MVQHFYGKIIIKDGGQRMSWGYGTIRFEGIDGDEAAVRQAVRKLCELLADSELEFDIEIDMVDIETNAMSA